MNVDGGTTVTPNAVAKADDIRATITRLIAAPSIVRVDLRLEGTPGPDGWNPVGEARHDGQVMRFVVASFEPDGTIALMTDGGVGDASGHWTVTFTSLATTDELTGAAATGARWVMEFDVP
jgi:hypothetical protein